MKTVAFIFLLVLGLAAAGNVGWWGGPSYSYHSRPVVVRRYYSPGWSGSGWSGSGWSGYGGRGSGWSGYGGRGWNSGSNGWW